MIAISMLAQEAAMLLAPFLQRHLRANDSAEVEVKHDKIEAYGWETESRLWDKFRPHLEERFGLAIIIQKASEVGSSPGNRDGAPLSSYLEEIMKSFPLETIADISNIVAEAKNDIALYNSNRARALPVFGRDEIFIEYRKAPVAGECGSVSKGGDVQNPILAGAPADIAVKETCCSEPEDSFRQYRYLNTFFVEESGASVIPPKEPLIRGQKYFLCLEVNPKQRGLGDDDQPFPDQAIPPGAWKDFSHLPLTVVASSRDFEIDSREQVLKLPREGPSSILKFGVTPRVSGGHGRIMVEVFYRGYLLQAKQVEALVVLPQPGSGLPSSPRPALTARTTFITNKLDWEDLSHLPERLLTIEVERDPKDGSLDFRFLDRTKEDAKLAFFDTHLQPQNISNAISGIRRQLNLMVQGQKGIEGYMWKLIGDDKLLNTWLPPLANAGHGFQRALLPLGKDQNEELAASLKPNTVIQVNPVFGLVTLPWALLYDREIKYIPGRTKVCDNFSDCEQDCMSCSKVDYPYLVCPYAFWGYRYAIEQLPCWVTESSPIPPTSIFKINNNLPISMNFNVYNSFVLWKDHISKIKSSAKIEVHTAEKIDEMEKIWKEQGKYLDIVYFYCHGGVDEILRLPYLKLSDGNIDSNFLDASSLNWMHNPLVFLNGCATGDYGPESYVSLISDFRKGGASGVVGTECPVPELFAEAYATALFNEFFQARPLGQAMLDVSKELLRKNKNPLGLVYTLYAYNQISLATPISKETGSGDKK